MALGSYVAGRYSAVWNGGQSLGMTKNGFEIEFSFKEEVLNETDLYGATTIDAVMRGCDVTLSAQLREWTAGAKAAIWPTGGGVMGKIFSVGVPPGVFASDLAQSLVLTATAGTPAATSPATLTASKAWIAPGFQSRWGMDSRLREMPMRMMLYPYISGSDLIAFSTT